VSRLLGSLILAALGVACASAPETVVLDPIRHGLVTLDGFREASPALALRLDAATAWAVFPDVADAGDACLHEGRLFTRYGAPRAVQLRCTRRPEAPAGTSHHVLVVFEDPADLAQLQAGALELVDAPLLSARSRSDAQLAQAASASRWIVTSALGGLLYELSHPAPLFEEVRLVPSERD